MERRGLAMKSPGESDEKISSKKEPKTCLQVRACAVVRAFTFIFRTVLGYSAAKMLVWVGCVVA